MRLMILLFCLVLLLGCRANNEPMRVLGDANTQLEVCFTPQNNCQQVLIDHIDSATQSIDVQAYSFTSYPIVKALVRAKSRGVVVRVILDGSDFDPTHFSQASYLYREGIAIWKDTSVAIAHSKVMIFDHDTVETGSFNYTKAAQHSNAENMLIVKNAAVAAAYEANFDKRQGLSHAVLDSGDMVLKNHDTPP